MPKKKKLTEEEISLLAPDELEILFPYNKPIPNGTETSVMLEITINLEDGEVEVIRP